MEDVTQTTSTSIIRVLKDNCQSLREPATVLVGNGPRSRAISEICH